MVWLIALALDFFFSLTLCMPCNFLLIARHLIYNHRNGNKEYLLCLEISRFFWPSAKSSVWTHDSVLSEVKPDLGFVISVVTYSEQQAPNPSTYGRVGLPESLPSVCSTLNFRSSFCSEPHSKLLSMLLPFSYP